MAERPLPRVVSLVPSISETLVAWGVRPVGVTRFCEQPGIPTVGGTKDPDLAAVVELRPDLVVVDREENRRPDAEALTAAGLTVHATHVRSVGDVGPELERLRVALGLPPLPAEEAEGNGRPAPRLRAVVPIWRRPWMWLGPPTYGSTLLHAAGAVNVLTGAEPYPDTDFSEVAALRPDVVLAPTEPYPFGERHAHHFAPVAPVVIVDGRDLFWWGARTPGALARLTALVDATTAALGTCPPPGEVVKVCP